MDFRVLGPLEVCDGDRPLPLGGFRQRLVLGALLLDPNRVVTTDWLVDAVWGEDPPRTARKTLQAYVARLRGVVGCRVIEAAATGYTLLVSPDDLDSLRFERLADEGHRLLADAPLVAAGVLRRALSQWRGMPWGELGDEPAIRPEAQRLRERRLAALEDRIAADLETGHAAGVVGELEMLVDEHPFREGFRAQLMLALYRSGRQSDALRAFQSVRSFLGEELGIEPCPDLRDLEEQILLHDPTIAGPQPEADLEDWTLARNPYKGLRAFGPEDSVDFFGRTDLVDQLVKRVEDHQFVAVVGASGSGKSSVLMAGLVPQLSPDRWMVATMVPGQDPFAALEAALVEVGPEVGTELGAGRGDDLDLLRAVQDLVPENGAHLLLVIDQFEELFHQVGDEAVRSRFVRNLVEAIEDPLAPLTVLVAQRADFLDRAMERSPLGELIGAEMVGVLPLRAPELEAAAARPAERAGVHMEPELIAELVGDMTDQPGALPLFQYVLTQLFEERTGPVLTCASYRRLGGLIGALSRRAEDTFQGLDPAAQAIGRQVFMRLVTVGANAEEDGRRRVERSSLEALEPGGGNVKAVLDAFDGARLLTFDSSPVGGTATVEVAHEALLREWPRMREWLDAAREDLRLHSALVAEVAEWEASGGDADYLLTGARLDLYDDWTTTTDIELIEPETAFLAASIARSEDERAREDTRRDEELRLGRRSVHRLRALVVVISVAALVAAGLTVFALNQGREAAASQREARARELANAAMANAKADPELAILLALAAIDATRPVDGFVVREAEEALHIGVNAHRLIASGRGQWDVEFGAGGSLVVGGDPVRVVDRTTGEARFDLPTPGDARRVESVAISDDGEFIATGSAGSGWVTMWDGRTGDEIATLGRADATVGGLEFSPDGRLLAALAPGPGRVQVWELATGRLLVERIDSEARRVYGPKDDISFNADGTRLAMTAGEEAWILDVTTGEWIVTLAGHDSLTTSVAFIPGRSLVVTGSTDGTFRLWDAETGTEIASVDAGAGQVVSLTVSGDGERLLTGGDNGAVRLWELAGDGARPAMTLPGVRSMVLDVDFDESGTTVAAIGLGGEVTTWDATVTGRGEVAAWPADGPVAFSSGGDRLAMGDAPGRGVVVVDVASWEPVYVLEDVVPYVGEETLGYGTEWGAIGGIAFDPDDGLIATTTHGYEVVPGTVTLWNTAHGDPVHTLVTHPALFGAAAFSADGTRIAAGACGPPGPPVTVWDTTTWEPLFAAPAGPCGRSVDLDASGRLVAVQTSLFDEANVQVWNVDSGDLVVEMTHPLAWTGGVEFSPTADRLLTAGGNGSLRVWELPTGTGIALLEGHTGPVEAAQWSADGESVVSAGLDGTVRLWNPATGEERRQLSGLAGQPSISMSPDGRWLATSAGGIAKVWALDLADLIDIAETRLTRSLSATECVTYHFENCPLP